MPPPFSFSLFRIQPFSLLLYIYIIYVHLSLSSFFYILIPFELQVPKQDEAGDPLPGEPRQHGCQGQQRLSGLRQPFLGRQGMMFRQGRAQDFITAGKYHI